MSKKECADLLQTIKNAEGELKTLRDSANAMCIGLPPEAVALCQLEKQKILAELKKVDRKLDPTRELYKESCEEPSWFTGSWFEKQKNKVLNWMWSNEKIKNYLESVETVGNWIREKKEDAWDKIRPGQRLTPAEKDLLKNGSGLPKSDYLKDKGGLFGDSIDYEKIRIARIPDILSGVPVIGTPKTIGNTIFLPNKVKGDAVFNPDGSLTDSGKALSIHETSHVWQNQNTDNSFILTLKTARDNIIYVGRRGVQYEWRDDAIKGIPFEKLRVEQQAQLIQELAVMPWADFYRVNSSYKDEVLRPYVLGALVDKVQKKKGAP